MKSFLRFCGAGGIGALLYCIILLGLTELAGVWYPVSALVAYVVNVVSNFLFHRYWTFQEGSRSRFRRQAFLYFGLSLVTCPANAVLLYLLTDATQFPYWFAQPFVTVVLYLSCYPLIQRIFAK